MDLQQQVYTPQEYDEYILGSAQVVGLMCLHVFTEGDKVTYERLKGSAMQLGSAFQKVNFLRDVKADYRELNRTYFPGVNLSAFSPEDKKEIEQSIKEEFNEALIGIRQLPASSRRGVYLAYIYYKKLFHKLSKATPDKVLTNRIRVSNSHKCWLMFDALVRCKMNAI